MTLKARKAQLTREIKAQREYVSDLGSIMQRQGEQFFFAFEGRKCPRYMYLGNYFFPHTVTKEQKILNKMIAERKDMDKMENLRKAYGVTYCIAGEECAKELSIGQYSENPHTIPF